MTSVFIAYRFSGENMEKLESFLTSVYDNLKVAGHDPFCSYWLENKFNKEQMTQEDRYQACLQIIDNMDVFMPIVKSADKSHGMEIESERAIKLDKRYVLAIKEGLDFPEFRKAAKETIEFKKHKDLFTAFRKFDK